jgi:hypothetical protein
MELSYRTLNLGHTDTPADLVDVSLPSQQSVSAINFKISNCVPNAMLKSRLEIDFGFISSETPLCIPRFWTRCDPGAEEKRVCLNFSNSGIATIPPGAFVDMGSLM